VDRRRTQTTFGSSSMRSHRVGSFQLLLQTNPPQPGGFAPHEARRRAVYRKTSSRVSKHYCNIAAGRGNGHPKTRSRDNARNWLGGPTARPQHLQEPSGATQVSILASRSRYLQTSSGLEYRHYVHSAARRIYLSRGGDRLVQSSCFGSSAFEQSGKHFLHRGLRGGDRETWTARDFQYRSRGPVFLTGICQCGFKQGDSLQHGWQREGSRQCVRGTIVAVGEI